MIGERIRLLRREKGLSITKLASLAGISKSYLSYIERNIQKNPSLQVLSKIAITLDTTIEYLLGEQQEMYTTSYMKQDSNMIDEEWEVLFQKAIEQGMSKEDFMEIHDFVKYKNWMSSQKKV
ncbi:helix-turn-helix domain-containing protein [Aquibacillus koreensis]|uniref:Helix-turn-helix domain-containing protein n=1 Tax=Aquibacillus koreensis TaxID=279446 RepID=A0A9X4AJ86_9BACI|nr:XRE family transcriptional regulator [Aquibacillus koreensis]MCT2534459.1 helix-turn-helix domain-containing protein [Aquibacillus koreensis]MDC3421766.1 helix-turn-helix domain-containing protein [Aquibacillus koreensis]